MRLELSVEWSSSRGASSPLLWRLPSALAVREPRWDDWEITYSGNRFQWLGNGVSQIEWDATAERSFYIRQQDDGPWASRWKRNAVLTRSGSLLPRVLHRQPRLAAQENGTANGKRKRDEEESLVEKKKVAKAVVQAAAEVV